MLNVTQPVGRKVSLFEASVAQCCEILDTFRRDFIERALCAVEGVSSFYGSDESEMMPAFKEFII